MIYECGEELYAPPENRTRIPSLATMCSTTKLAAHDKMKIGEYLNILI